MAATDGPVHLLSLKVMRVSVRSGFLDPTQVIDGHLQRPELASAWEPFYSSSPSFSVRALIAQFLSRSLVPRTRHIHLPPSYLSKERNLFLVTRKP
jgi:hypothetical protein